MIIQFINNAKASHINFNRGLKHSIKYYETLHSKILDARGTKRDNINQRI